MSIAGEQAGAARAYKQAPSHPSSFFGVSRLPPDLAAVAVKRIGFLGLVCAVTAPLSYLTEYYLQPARILLPGRFPFPQVVAPALMVLGLVVFALAKSRRIGTGAILNLGLIFQVVVALGISLSEHAGPLDPGDPIRGISWNCLWISVFVVAVPGTFLKTTLAVLASASMSAAGLAITTAVNANPLPSDNQIAVLLLPNLLAAGWAVPVARYVYNLGARLSRAREMGSYALLDLIGSGGMGEVWRAEHRMLARAAAVKLIRPEALGMAGAGHAEVLVRRFELEARATAALRCPHTVDLYDFGLSEDGRFYYAMELLEGLDLEALVQRFGPQPPARVVYMLRQVCKSLAEAHERGLVHRDIKPRNVFACRLGLEYDFVKVLDFGLAKSLAAPGEATGRLTADGVAAGTPAYMAPEIALGSEPVDGRADLYAVGCVAYWLLTGQLVFARPTPMAMALAHVQAAPAPPSSVAETEIPTALEEIILRCLEKSPAARPQTAAELLRLLQAVPCSADWEQEQAERWWRTHLPDMRPAPHAYGPASSTAATQA